MTSSDLRAWLSTLAEVHALVPASEVLERLPADAAEQSADTLRGELSDLDAEEAGRVLKRSASTVRDYCRCELLPGSYRQRGREWRVPHSAIRIFQRNEAAPPEEFPISASRSPSSPPDLGGWRKEVGKDPSEGCRQTRVSHEVIDPNTRT